MNILSRALRLVCHLHVLKLENCGLSGRAIVILGIYLVTIFFYALECTILHISTLYHVVYIYKFINFQLNFINIVALCVYIYIRIIYKDKVENLKYYITEIRKIRS